MKTKLTLALICFLVIFLLFPPPLYAFLSPDTLSLVSVSSIPALSSFMIALGVNVLIRLKKIKKPFLIIVGCLSIIFVGINTWYSTQQYQGLKFNNQVQNLLQLSELEGWEKFTQTISPYQPETSSDFHQVLGAMDSLFFDRYVAPVDLDVVNSNEIQIYSTICGPVKSKEQTNYLVTLTTK